MAAERDTDFRGVKGSTDRRQGHRKKNPLPSPPPSILQKADLENNGELKAVSLRLG